MMRRGVTPRPALTLPSDIQEVLDEIDELSRLLRSIAAASAEERGMAEPGPEADSDSAGWDEGLPTEGPPAPIPTSPYLEERLAQAAASLGSLRSRFSGLAETWDELEGAVDTLEGELGNAARELRFLRSAGSMGEPGAVSLPRSRPRPAATAAGSAPYTEFTIRKYNATVGSLKGRRSTLLGWTFVLAALISLGLVAVQILAHEPMPSVWLALLPLVWMIPVPFFLLSFFGTQRVLRRNHLDLAEGR